MSSSPTPQPKNNTSIFWPSILLIALIFYLVNESEKNVPKAHKESITPRQSEVAPATTDTAQRRISETSETTTALRVPFSRPVACAAVNDLLIDHTGTLWAATESGVTSIQNDQVTHYQLSQGTFPFAQAQCLAQDGHHLWVGSLFGLSRHDENKRFTRVYADPELPSSMIWSMVHNGKTLWLGTQNGAAFLDEADHCVIIDSTTTNNGLRHNWCQKIFWLEGWFVAAHNRGISMWNTAFPAANPEWWKNIDHADTMATRPITDFAFDGERLWLSTPRGVMYLVTPVNRLFSDFTPNLVSYSRTHGLPADRTNSMIYHRRALWIASNEGLARIKDDQVQLILPESAAPVTYIRKLAASGDLLWLGTTDSIQFINTAMLD